MRNIGLILALAFAILVGRAAEPHKAPEIPATTTPAEAELGAKTAETIERDYKLVKDEAQLARINAIANLIAPFSERPGVVYKCKILDTGALNAMAIPGGTIYVTRGLLNAVESDDELAGVLAHEIAHNALCHAEKMMKREAKASLQQLLILIPTIFVARNSDEVGAGTLLTMSELVKQALLNGYSTELEEQADAHGLAYLARLNKYNPVGLYSVILGFEQIERRSPQIELGYAKTHPLSKDRRKALEAKLAELKVTVNLWQVVGFRATTEGPKGDDPKVTLKLGAINLLTLATPDAKARADEAAAAINRRLSQVYIQQFDVDYALKGNQATLRLRRIPVLTLTDADAQAANTTVEALAQLAQTNAREAIWREILKREG